MRAAGKLAGVVAALGLLGCRAKPPSEIETKVITSAKHSLFVGNRTQKNPLPDGPGVVSAGREAFGHFCVACHGLDAQNTGVPFAQRMSPPVPSLASEDVQSYTDGQLKRVIDEGIRPSGMPGAKGMLSDEEIWSIIRFLRHLPPPGSFGEPEMYTH